MEVIEETGNEGIKISIVQDHPVFTVRVHEFVKYALMEVIEETGNEGIKISIVQDHPVFTDFCILVCDETGDNQILSIIEVKKPEVYASLTLPTKAVAQVLREAQIRLCEIVSTISLPSQVIATIQQVRKLHCPPVKQSSTFRGFALVVPARIFFSVISTVILPCCSLYLSCASSSCQCCSFSLGSRFFCYYHILLKMFNTLHSNFALKTNLTLLFFSTLLSLLVVRMLN